MKRILRTAAYAAIVLTSATFSFGQAIPSAEAILDRYVEVTGGKEAYESHTTEVLTGSIAFPAQGLKGRLKRYAAAPNKEYSLVELDAIGKIESGVQDGYPWEKSAVMGPRVKAGDEREEALHEAQFNAPVHWRKTYPKVEAKGEAVIDGEACYEVLLTPEKGRPQRQFYSKKSGLLMRTTMTAASPMGEVQVEVNVSDYKRFGDVLFPTKSSQKAAGQEILINIDYVSFNETIPANVFEPPPDVAAMIRKAMAAVEERL